MACEIAHGGPKAVFDLCHACCRRAGNVLESIHVPPPPKWPVTLPTVGQKLSLSCAMRVADLPETYWRVARVGAVCQTYGRRMGGVWKTYGRRREAYLRQCGDCQCSPPPKKISKASFKIRFKFRAQNLEGIFQKPFKLGDIWKSPLLKGF